ncbi:unnamed protein product [Sphagnum jensenii]
MRIASSLSSRAVPDAQVTCAHERHIYRNRHVSPLWCSEFSNPCVGSPYTSAGGQILYCNTGSVCPPNYFCHFGQDSTTTMCCPSSGELVQISHCGGAISHLPVLRRSLLTSRRHRSRKCPAHALLLQRGVAKLRVVRLLGTWAETRTTSEDPRSVKVAASHSRTRVRPDSSRSRMRRVATFSVERRRACRLARAQRTISAMWASTSGTPSAVQCKVCNRISGNAVRLKIYFFSNDPLRPESGRGCRRRYAPAMVLQSIHWAVPAFHLSRHGRKREQLPHAARVRPNVHE